METNNEALETLAQDIALELAYAPTCIDCDDSIWYIAEHNLNKDEVEKRVKEILNTDYDFEVVSKAMQNELNYFLGK